MTHLGGPFNAGPPMTDRPTNPSSGPPPHPLAARLPFFYGWIVVGVAFLTMGIGVNTRTAFSLLFPPILDEFGWERGATAAAFTVGFVASAAFTPFIGVLMDRIGPRYTMPMGGVLIAAGLALSTLATAPWHFYMTLGVLVVGGSIFLAYIGHSMFLANWFARRRGLAVGIAFSGVGVGAIVLFPWLQVIIDELGWREACWVLAFLLLAIVLPLNLLLQRQRPADLGLEPDGDGRGGTGVRLPPVDNVVDRAWAETDWTLASAARTARFWWLSLAFGTGLYAWYAVQVHQTKYLIEIGFDPLAAAYALGFVGFAGVAGQIGLGYLSDRIGREWVWTISLAGYVLCYLLLLAMKAQPSPLLMYLMVGAQGVLGYGLASIYGTAPADIFQGPRLATILGSISLAANLGAGIGPWATGVIHDRTGAYDAAWWLAIALALVSILAIWCAGPRKVRLVSGQAARRAR